MLCYILLVQHLHFPTKQLSKFGADDFLFGLGLLGCIRAAVGSFTLVGPRGSAGFAWLWRSRFVHRLTLADGWSWEIISLIHCLHSALEAFEQSLSAQKSRIEIDGVGKLID